MPEAPSGQRFGRYRVIRELGRGAMGEVYLAEDDSLGRSVAVKTIRTRGGEAAVAMFRARFANEAKAAGALTHPNIVAVFDIGCVDNTPFLVMEVVAGRSLKARLADERLRANQVRVLGIQMARALDHAHARGIAHRDVKPANILEGTPGTWKLADFGIARVPDSSLTLTGQFLGSPSYAAPEALRGELTAKGDVYGLAATLYECLTGEPPYGERELAAILAMSAKSDPTPIRAIDPDVPEDLAAAIERGLVRDPAQRPTAARFAEELAGCGESVAPTASAAAVELALPVRAVELPPRPRIGRVALIGAGMLVAVGIAVSYARPQHGAAALPEKPAAVQAMPVEPVHVETEQVAAPSETDPMTAGSARQAERWHQIDEHLRDGDYHRAREELERLLDDDPDDAYARSLLDQLPPERRGPRGRGKHKHDVY